MGSSPHPKTGEMMKDHVFFYEFCSDGEEHPGWKRTADSWAEIIDECTRCGYHRGARIG